MPVYLFAVSQVPQLNIARAIIIFVILHVLVYPASNAYNSYMDKDEESIGGIKDPLQPTLQLFHVSIAMDIISIALSFFISIWFTIGIIAYIIASRAYSYRGIRLKKYPYIGYFTVILFQGAVTFFVTYHGSSNDLTTHVPLEGMLIATVLIGGFYPLTQIYQHQADARDGVKTISAALGYRGTFFLTGIMYTIAMSCLFFWFNSKQQLLNYCIVATAMLPVVVYFFIWLAKVWKHESAANFTNTMRMNLLASVCTNAAFLILLIRR